MIHKLGHCRGMAKVPDISAVTFIHHSSGLIYEILAQSTEIDGKTYPIVMGTQLITSMNLVWYRWN